MRRICSAKDTKSSPLRKCGGWVRISVWGKREFSSSRNQSSNCLTLGCCSSASRSATRSTHCPRVTLLGAEKRSASRVSNIPSMRLLSTNGRSRYSRRPWARAISIQKKLPLSTVDTKYGRSSSMSSIWYQLKRCPFHFRIFSTEVRVLSKRRTSSRVGINPKSRAAKAESM